MKDWRRHTGKLLLFIIILYSENIYLQNLDDLKHIQRNDTSQINILIETGKQYAKSDFDSATFYLDSAVHYAYQIENYQKVWKAYYTKANLYRKHDSLGKALVYYQKALDVADSYQLELQKATALLQFTIYGVVVNNPPEAFDNYLKVLEIYKKYNYISGITKVYNNLAVCHINCQKFEDAERYMQLAYESSLSLQDTSLSIDIQINMGLLYLKQKKYKKTNTLYTKLIQELKAKGEEEKLDHVYYNLGLMKVAQKDFQTALRYYNQALNLFQQNKNYYYSTVLKLQKANVFLNIQKPDSARYYLLETVKSAKKSGSLDIEALAQEELVNIYKNKKNFKKAFEASQRLYEIDKIKNRNTKYQSIEVQELLLQNKEKQEIISLKDQIIASEKSKKKLFFIILFVLILLLISLIVAVISTIKSHKKSKQLYEQQIHLNQVEYEKSLKEELINQLEFQKLENELKNKQRQLVSTALLIEQNQKTIQEIFEEIVNLKENNTDKVPIKSIDRLIRNMKQKQIEQNQWDLFKTHFDQTYKNFIVNLQQKHPDLTKTELRFCTYLRIQLPSKQIATILNITPETIYKIRYRIRKKMNLSKEGSLDTYLLEF